MSPKAHYVRRWNASHGRWSAGVSEAIERSILPVRVRAAGYEAELVLDASREAGRVTISTDGGIWVGNGRWRVEVGIEDCAAVLEESVYAALEEALEEAAIDAAEALGDKEKRK